MVNGHYIGELRTQIYRFSIEFQIRLIFSDVFPENIRPKNTANKIGEIVLKAKFMMKQ